ncbi:hypothetical protein EUGRSUZ_B02091 [Eucalyptus grandis]|uniref:Uncharacterized protein n=2 Tax=Eucalyptus grandis TaxID=71139 RepID=A0ACC3LRJ3_EUCGR|nr:hypothetical protein EUGRSUZ_B02091 [Eucalyptus grandis]
MNCAINTLFKVFQKPKNWMQLFCIVSTICASKNWALKMFFWVGRVDSLHTATYCIEESKVVGVDCEWKPNYVKGSKPNKEILGAGLNKTKRNSNWEQRPLNQNQLEYAALHAAVPVHIFHHIQDQSQQGTADGNDKIEWKSSIISHLDDAKTTKKNVWNRTKCRVDTN